MEASTDLPAVVVVAVFLFRVCRTSTFFGVDFERIFSISTPSAVLCVGLKLMSLSAAREAPLDFKHTQQQQQHNSGTD
jgi:hypothetical protein